MKTIIKYSLGVFLWLATEAACAQPVIYNKSYNSIPSTTSAKGRRELRKDKRIRRHEEHLAKANEKKMEPSTKPFHKKSRPKPSKGNVEVRKND